MRSRFWSLCLGACVLLSFAALGYPLYVIRPFRAQGVHELAAALAVLRFRPFLEAALMIAALLALFFYWRLERRILRRSAAVAAALAVCGFALLSRVNVYELMFHPLERPSFSPAATAKLDGDEKVIAVNIGGAARAYPVRGMSYHHIVNDTLGGVPIAATY